MKHLHKMLCFIAGVGVTVFACILIDRGREDARRTMLLSNLQYPVLDCLNDIVQTHDRGQPALALEKLRLLQHHWSTYTHGGPPPEQFTSQITDVTPATRGTAPAPNLLRR
jgi:hypothetical protein